MNNFLIALLASVGFATWVYTKQMRRSGNNTKSSVIFSGIVAIMTFVVILTVAITVDSMIK